MYRIKKDPLFADSTYQVSVCGDDMVTAVHTKGGQTLAGVFSLKGRTANAFLPLPDGTYRDLISGSDVEVFRSSVMCCGEPIILRMDH